MQAYAKKKLIKRLTGYWRLEAGNMVLIPAFVYYFTKAQLSTWTAVSMFAVALLLGVGAMYWRAKLHQLQGKGEGFEMTMVLIKRMQTPTLILTLLSLAYCGLLWLRPEMSRGRPDQIAISAMAALAALEYINYYHRQLNYFDNIADLKRVFTGKGFQPSQMRRDLDQLARRK
jgi:hypothetical protein